MIDNYGNQQPFQQHDTDVLTKDERKALAETLKGFTAEAAASATANAEHAAGERAVEAFLLRYDAEFYQSKTNFDRIELFLSANNWPCTYRNLELALAELKSQNALEKEPPRQSQPVSVVPVTGGTRQLGQPRNAADINAISVAKSLPLSELRKLVRSKTSQKHQNSPAGQHDRERNIVI